MSELVVAKVDRDYFASDILADDYRVGTEWTYEHLVKIGFIEHDQINREDLCVAKKLRFRMKDDDGEIYYGGWLLDDDYGEVQQAVLSWGQYDAGCTTIEVKNEAGEWIQEIG